MPKEVKVVDKTMRKDPSTGKMVKNENYRGVTWNEKVATVKKGNVVRKRVTSENYAGVQGGKPDVEKTLKVEKFDKAGKLKKSTVISNGTKTVTRPGEKPVTKKAGLLASVRLNKNV
jgi:hypothetical protein